MSAMGSVMLMRNPTQLALIKPGFPAQLTLRRTPDLRNAAARQSAAAGRSRFIKRAGRRLPHEHDRSIADMLTRIRNASGRKGPRSAFRPPSSRFHRPGAKDEGLEGSPVRENEGKRASRSASNTTRTSL